MKHKKCNGQIIEKLPPNQETIQLECLKCGKVWSVLSDLSDIESNDLRNQKSSNLLGFEFEKFYVRSRLPNSLINYLYNDRLRRLFKMVDFSSERKYVGLDVGCSAGYFTQFLTERLSGIVVGIDVSKVDLSRAKIRTRLSASSKKSAIRGTVEFVRSTINYLPFREDSIDFVFSASVLEHIKDLDGAVKEIESLMKKEGSLIVGYPIEASLFMAFLKLFLPVGLYIRDPRISGKEKFEKNPGTHKQKFTDIRLLLQKHFVIVHKEKSFFTFLPDQVSWYECVKMTKRAS